MGPVLSVTTRSAEPLAAVYQGSPAKLACAAAGYAPAPIPGRLTPFTVARPSTSVVADPAARPFKVNVISRPAIGEPENDSVADKDVAPPATPAAGETIRSGTAVGAGSVSRYTVP